MRDIVKIVEQISEDIMYRERHMSIMDAVKDVGMRSVKEVLRWIPVSEAVPDQYRNGLSEPVLTRNKDKKLIIQKYDCIYDTFNKDNDVVEWRPVYEHVVPEEVQEEEPEDIVEKGYRQLLKSGMFWEFYPMLSGIWDEDKEEFKKTFKP